MLILSIALLILGLGVNYLWQSRGPELAPRAEGSLRIAPLNVHYIIMGQREGRWSEANLANRQAPLDATFKALGADIVGFQEMESFARRSSNDVNLARDWLLAENPGYAAAASGDPAQFPSTQPILYRPDRLELLDQGWFFFSETPDVIYSRTFNGSFPAFASWADFEVRETGNSFRVLNIHLDYSSRENRRLSTELIADRVAGWRAEGREVILIGDMNALRGSRLHRMLEGEGLSFLPVAGATVHFDRGLNLFGAIDHVAHSDGLRPVGAPMGYREKLGEVWPTDHYPVLADFAL